MKRKSRFLLPLSWLYKAGVIVHNKMYDWGWKKTATFHLPVICVGNLSVGGTGKTPMVEYLLRLLSPQYKIATISRGYKRQTTGMLIANKNTTAAEIGDEPLQFYSKFPGTKVVVAEKRAEAINSVVQQFPSIDVIILDDAFQHRAVSAGLNILLTEYSNLFVDDFYLPAGQLRDLKSNYKKAQAIVVTKCPPNLTVLQKNQVIQKIGPQAYQQVFFTSIQYEQLYGVFHHAQKALHDVQNALVVTGIANPNPLLSYLKRHDISFSIISFPDHHRFSQNDIDTVKKTFESMKQQNKIIITTEKDAMRLREFKHSLQEFPVFAIPVAHRFLFDEGDDFNKMVFRFIQNKKIGYGKKKQAFKTQGIRLKKKN